MNRIFSHKSKWPKAFYQSWAPLDTSPLGWNRSLCINTSFYISRLTTCRHLSIFSKKILIRHLIVTTHHYLFHWTSLYHLRYSLSTKAECFSTCCVRSRFKTKTKAYVTAVHINVKMNDVPFNDANAFVAVFSRTSVLSFFCAIIHSMKMLQKFWVSFLLSIIWIATRHFL